jgi:hypothetical protein
LSFAGEKPFESENETPPEFSVLPQEADEGPRNGNSGDVACRMTIIVKDGRMK